MARVARVRVHVQAVLVGVVVDACLEQVVGIDARGAQKVHAVLVPIGPAPVADDVLARGAAGIHGVALLAFLAHIAQRVFVRGIGREAQLERQPLVRAVGVVAVVARVGGLLLEVLEALGQRKTVRVQVGGAKLVVPGAQVAAQVHGGLAFAACACADACIALERFDGLARDQVDGAAQRIGAIHQRCASLGHADLGQVERGEAAEVHIAVIGHVQRHAVHEDRHLARIEAAQVNHFLVAIVARQRGARQQAHGVGHGVGIALAHLGGAQSLFIAGYGLCFITRTVHIDRAQLEGLRSRCCRCTRWGLDLGLRLRAGGQACEQQGLCQCGAKAERG